MIPLAMLLGYGILVAGSDLLAVPPCSSAVRLGVPGAAMIAFLPWMVLAAYAAAVVGLARIKRGRVRWVAFFLTSVAAFAVFPVAANWLERQTVGIEIAGFISKENGEALKKAYPVKWTCYSSGRTFIRVRREDYSAELARFVQDLVVKQADPNSPHE